MLSGRYNIIVISSLVLRFNICPGRTEKESEEDEQRERHLMSGGLLSVGTNCLCISCQFFLIDGLFVSS